MFVEAFETAGSDVAMRSALGFLAENNEFHQVVCYGNTSHTGCIALAVGKVKSIHVLLFSVMT